MSTNPKISKLYIITRDQRGHIHHFVSKTASMHLDIVLEHDIDLDTNQILEKGFIHEDHHYTANLDIRGEAVRKAHQDRRRKGHEDNEKTKM